MLSVKERGLLINIIKHCERINEKTKDITREQFESDKDIMEIVCFNILQIGELAKNLSEDFVSKHNSVPWKSIKGMRDRVAHGYGTIDKNKVWDTVIIHVKPLQQYCEKLINND